MSNRPAPPSWPGRTGHTIEGSPEPDGVGRSEVGVQAELQAEQEFVDMAYARLDAMRSDANAMLEECSTWAGAAPSSPVPSGT